MSFAGSSHVWLIAVMGLWIVVVFVGVARVSRASRRAIVGALVGSLVAAAVNIGTDSAAHAAGFWRYVEVTTPFGPILYYLEAGLGCGALAVGMLWLRRRASRRALGLVVVVLGVYAPFRDWATAELTHLLEFHYEPWLLVVVADAMSTLVIPVLVAYAITSAVTRGEPRQA